MFDRMFQFIRRGVRDAILGGIDDAQAEIAGRFEAREPITIEAKPTDGNGKPKARQKAGSR